MVSASDQFIEGWEDEEYKAFREKFKAKKTTDDCYTPPNIYEAVASWVAEEYGVDQSVFVRPFYPGGDFEKFEYPDGCIVVDNPPFSIISRILKFYSKREIPFFIFAPALTLFSSAKNAPVTRIPVGISITYDNGAKVATSFITNMEPRTLRVRTAPTLYKAVDVADKENLAKEKKALPKYEYPDNVITAAMVQRWCKYGVDYRLEVSDSLPISALDAQKARGITIFGEGYILSSSAAAEKAAAEKAAAEKAAAEKAAAEKWQLSDKELEIVRYIDSKKCSKSRGGSL